MPKNLFDYTNELLQEIENFTTDNKEALEQFRIKHLGSKGTLKQLMKNIKDIPNEQKRAFGQLANKVKQTTEQKFSELKESLETEEEQVSVPDLMRPAELSNIGSRHPISIVKAQMCEIFERIGFVTVDGPEVEDDWHNACTGRAQRVHRGCVGNAAIWQVDACAKEWRGCLWFLRTVQHGGGVR